MPDSQSSPQVHPDLLAALKTQEPPYLEVFADSNYQGRSQKLPTSKNGRDAKYNAADLNSPDGIGTGTLSSLRFTSAKAPGFVHSVTLYAEDGCRGASKTFTESTTWVGDDFNDRTTSIEIVNWIV